MKAEACGETKSSCQTWFIRGFLSFVTTAGSPTVISSGDVPVKLFYPEVPVHSLMSMGAVICSVLNAQSPFPFPYPCCSLRVCFCQRRLKTVIIMNVWVRSKWQAVIKFLLLKKFIARRIAKPAAMTATLQTAGRRTKCKWQDCLTAGSWLRRHEYQPARSPSVCLTVWRAKWATSCWHMSEPEQTASAVGFKWRL